MSSWYAEVIPYLFVGLRTTILLSIVSMLVSVAAGLVLGMISVLLPKLSPLVSLYNQIWRGFPVLVTLFFAFFFVPAIGIPVSSFVAAVIGLALWGSANIAEIVIGALKSVASSQRNAGLALGFSPMGSLLRIELPQAVRRMLPSSVGILVLVIQSTALASAIGALDILETANRSMQSLILTTGSSHAVEIYGMVLILFFAICFPLSLLARRIEKRYA